MNIVVNDANVLIDLVKLRLLPPPLVQIYNLC